MLATTAAALAPAFEEAVDPDADQHQDERPAACCARQNANRHAAAATATPAAAAVVATPVVDVHAGDSDAQQRRGERRRAHRIVHGG